MDCEDVRYQLAGYADGELSPVEAEAVEAHIKGCGRCRQAVHDQQRVQHVLASFAPPPVEDNRWAAMGKVLKAELEGEGEPVVLKTRPHVESLDPTPPEEPAEPTPASAPTLEVLEPGSAELESLLKRKKRATEEEVEETPTPEPKPAPRVAQRRPPAISVLTVTPRRRRARQPLAWVAHAFGALAAMLIVALGVLTIFFPPEPKPLQAESLARQRDVQIHGIEMNADYDLVLYAAGPDDVASVWVTPAEPEPGPS